MGIWWESFPVRVKIEWALTKIIFRPNSYQPPGFRPDSSDSARHTWGTVKYSWWWGGVVMGSPLGSVVGVGVRVVDV